MVAAHSRKFQNAPRPLPPLHLSRGLMSAHPYTHELQALAARPIACFARAALGSVKAADGRLGGLRGRFLHLEHCPPDGNPSVTLALKYP